MSKLIKRTSIGNLKNGNISKENAYLVIAMRIYPRFLPKALVHEFAQSLSPQADLFARYREYKKKSGDQNQAFQFARYEQEFALSELGMKELKRIVDIAEIHDVYLICQCESHEFCHVDLILLIAQKKLGARIGKLASDYSEFMDYNGFT